jgi:hypothetical protein
MWTTSIINPRCFELISRVFGPFDVDRFASEHNTKLPRFNAFYWCSKAEACNAFTQARSGTRNFCFPPLIWWAARLSMRVHILLLWLMSSSSGTPRSGGPYCAALRALGGPHLYMDIGTGLGGTTPLFPAGPLVGCTSERVFLTVGSMCLTSASLER